MLNLLTSLNVILYLVSSQTLGQPEAVKPAVPWAITVPPMFARGASPAASGARNVPQPWFSRCNKWVGRK
jgi:hypothetical protein